jgi:hypothetical protein
LEASWKGTKLRILKAITFHYDGKQDRILAVANPGQAEAWSCWLTRRLTLALLERSAEFLEKSSDLAKRASADVRGDLVNFERDAAIANTAAAMSNTPQNIIKDGAATAELLQQLSFTRRGDRFRIELRGDRGGGADGSLTRDEFQRILQMLQAEVGKAGWTVAPATTVAAPTSEAAHKPLRH